MVESSSLVFREAFSHPNISFFHLLIIELLVSVLLDKPLPFLWVVLVGGKEFMRAIIYHFIL